MVYGRYSIEIIKVLLDGRWHSTHSLVVLIGDYIKPEVAYRCISKRRCYSIKAGLREGQRSVIFTRLYTWFNTGLVKKRKRKGYCEWRVKDRKYFEKVLKEVK